MPSSEDVRRGKFAGAAGRARNGEPEVRTWRQGDEPERASGLTVGALGEFIGFYRGLEKAAGEEDGFTKGGGGTGRRPCEVIAEVDAMLRRTVDAGRVPEEYLG